VATCHNPENGSRSAAMSGVDSDPVSHVIGARAENHEHAGALARRIAQRFDAGCALLRFTASAGWVQTLAYHHDDEAFRAIIGEFAATTERIAESPALAALAGGESVLMGSDRIEGLESALSARTRPLAQRAGLRSLLGVPIRVHGSVVGALVLTRTGSDPSFSPADRDALEQEAAALEDTPMLHGAAHEPELAVDPHERFGAAFVHAPVGFALFRVRSRDGRRLMDVNPALCEILRAGPEELLAHPAPQELVHPDDTRALYERWGRVRSTADRDADLELRMRRFDGTEFEAALQLSLIRDLAGKPLYGLAQLQDITARRTAEGRLRAHSEQQRLVGALARRALEEPDVDRLIDEGVRTVAEVLDADHVRMIERLGGGDGTVTRSAHGWPAESSHTDDLARRYATLLRDADPRPLVIEDVETMTPSEVPSLWREQAVRSAVIARVATPAGDAVGCLSVLSRRPRGYHGDEVRFLEAVAGVLGAAIDRQRAVGAARRQTLHDPLTGLPLRTLFMDRVRHALARAGRGRTTVAVLLLDLDRFQRVNDAIGYGGGDDLLIATTSRLRQVLRSQDTLARLGSDEFAVLCEDVPGEAGASRTAERLLEALGTPMVIDEEELVVTASIGVVVAEPSTRSPEALVGSADIAMCCAKAEGGARWVIFEPRMRRRAGERARLESDLRRALENGEFELHYQPIVRLEDPRVVAVEALLRWRHPERGMVSPAAFVPVAEETGLIVPLGEWVVREACRQLAVWESDPAIDLPYMTVNVSGRQLAEPSLPADLCAILRRTGVAPERLALELTESVLMEETSSPTAMLHQLKALGVRLLLDDFGTGYSSLNYVKRFPVEAIKVDRSFLAEVTEDEGSRNFLRAIVTMAAALDVDVVAEGVETDDQLRWMRRLGFALAQGYGLCRPAPAARLQDVLRSGLDIGWLRDVPRVADDGREASRRHDRGGDVPSITLGEAAEALGVSASTLRRWADAGRIRVVRTAGGHRRFPTAEVRRLAAASSTLRRPVLRGAQLPVTALPVTRDLLRERGEEIAGGAARTLYEPARSGWFAAATAADPIGRWLAALVAACGTGQYADVVGASRRLAATAGYAGASLVERHDFVDRFGEIALRRLQELQAPRDELIGLRRLVLRIRQAVLEEASAAE
jgi:diguanylate cyclase (GGDEF)-like protein/PAS domain S-box-containing protein/excisionase family DNA binding protein